MEINGLTKLRCSAALSGAAPGVIRAAGIRDAQRIEELYKSIQITGSGVSAGNFKDFSLNGGMFEIPSRQQILSECGSENLRFTIGEYGGKLEAVMRLSADTSIYKPIIACGKDVLNYVELVVRSERTRFVYPFLRANFKLLLDAGYKGLLFQIYHLLSLTKGGKLFPLGIDNNASRGLNMKIGATPAGALPQKTLAYGGNLLQIRPDVYVIELSQTVKKLEILCEKAHWRLY